jgi:hypothetical protein
MEEIKEYSERFWSLIEDLEEHKRFISVIEKGESMLQQKEYHAKLVSSV